MVIGIKQKTKQKACLVPTSKKNYIYIYISCLVPTSRSLYGTVFCASVFWIASLYEHMCYGSVWIARLDMAFGFFFFFFFTSHLC